MYVYDVVLGIIYSFLKERKTCALYKMENLTNAVQFFMLGSFHIFLCNFMHQTVSTFVLNIELVKIIHQSEKNYFSSGRTFYFS